MLLVFGVALAPPKSRAIIYFSPPTSIVQNGDFSGLTDWSFAGNGGYGEAFNGGADGGGYVILGSLNQDPIYQSVPTTPGLSYTLTFYWRGPAPIMQSPPFAMNVLWNSQEVGSFTLNVFSSDWVYESLTVVGSGSQGLLEFEDPDLTDSALDDVSLVPVPEPSAFALVGCAMIALAWIRHRK